jgi:hypothetical protein
MHDRRNPRTQRRDLLGERPALAGRLSVEQRPPRTMLIDVAQERQRPLPEPLRWRSVATS